MAISSSLSSSAADRLATRPNIHGVNKLGHEQLCELEYWLSD